MKYGALSASVGGVHISWRVDPSEAGEIFLVCEWQERGGPPCYPPKTRGYGTELIEGTARHLGGSANLEFDSSGLIATIKFPA